MLRVACRVLLIYRCSLRVACLFVVCCSCVCSLCVVCSWLLVACCLMFDGRCYMLLCVCSSLFVVFVVC